MNMYGVPNENDGIKTCVLNEPINSLSIGTDKAKPRKLDAKILSHVMLYTTTRK